MSERSDAILRAGATPVRADMEIHKRKNSSGAMTLAVRGGKKPAIRSRRNVKTAAQIRGISAMYVRESLIGTSSAAIQHPFSRSSREREDATRGADSSADWRRCNGAFLSMLMRRCPEDPSENSKARSTIRLPSPRDG